VGERFWRKGLELRAKEREGEREGERERECKREKKEIRKEQQGGAKGGTLLGDVARNSCTPQQNLRRRKTSLCARILCRALSTDKRKPSARFMCHCCSYACRFQVAWRELCKERSPATIFATTAVHYISFLVFRISCCTVVYRRFPAENKVRNLRWICMGIEGNQNSGRRFESMFHLATTRGKEFEMQWPRNKLGNTFMMQYI